MSRAGSRSFVSCFTMMCIRWNAPRSNKQRLCSADAHPQRICGCRSLCSCRPAGSGGQSASASPTEVGQNRRLRRQMDDAGCRSLTCTDRMAEYTAAAAAAGWFRVPHNVTFVEGWQNLRQGKPTDVAVSHHADTTDVAVTGPRRPPDLARAAPLRPACRRREEVSDLLTAHAGESAVAAAGQNADTHLGTHHKDPSCRSPPAASKS